MRSAASENTQKFAPRPSKLAPRGRITPDRISLTRRYPVARDTLHTRRALGLGPPYTDYNSRLVHEPPNLPPRGGAAAPREPAAPPAPQPALCLDSRAPQPALCLDSRAPQPALCLDSRAP